ncbi:MAG: tRNA (guanosine(46)-N7)-methyltransferase TrmB [Deltaproteobacteria bacterium]|nr:tRNA (guanosine(46)-N7)-methyltransferase TrmB [Deltaproteobacteria bacterium]
MVHNKGRNSDFKSSHKAFGRKAVKLSASQKDLLEKALPKVEIPFKAGIIDLSSYFEGSGPLHLEIGFGNGEYTAALADALPDAHIVGCEIFLNGIAALLKHREEKNLQNIWIIHGSALMAMEEIFADELFDYIHINHPDPWPKKRHTKRRIIQSHTVELLLRKLKKGGEVWLSTDAEAYYEWMKEAFQSCDAFEKIPVEGRFLDEVRQDKIKTRYEKKGAIHGRGTQHLMYRKK